MHYNAFLAVLFLRIVLYGQQHLVSFTKFPCTDGLGPGGYFQMRRSGGGGWEAWTSHQVWRQNLGQGLAKFTK